VGCSTIESRGTEQKEKEKKNLSNSEPPLPLYDLGCVVNRKKGGEREKKRKGTTAPIAL